MQDRREDRWVRCPNCGHKLFKALSDSPFAINVAIAQDADEAIMETKCHSCKKIIAVSIL